MDLSWAVSIGKQSGLNGFLPSLVRDASCHHAQDKILTTNAKIMAINRRVGSSCNGIVDANKTSAGDKLLGKNREVLFCCKDKLINIIQICM